MRVSLEFPHNQETDSMRSWIAVTALIAALGAAGCGTKAQQPAPAGDELDQKIARGVVAGVKPLYDRLGNIESNVQSLQEGQKITHGKLDKVDHKVDVYGKRSSEEHNLLQNVLAAIQNCLGACGAKAEKPAAVQAPAKPRAVVARTKAKPVVKPKAKATATTPCPPVVVQPPPPAPVVADEGRVPPSIFAPNAPTHYDWWRRERAEDTRRQVYFPPPPPDMPRTVPPDQRQQKKRCPDPCR